MLPPWFTGLVLGVVLTGICYSVLAVAHLARFPRAAMVLVAASCLATYALVLVVLAAFGAPRAASCGMLLTSGVLVGALAAEYVRLIRRRRSAANEPF